MYFWCRNSASRVYPHTRMWEDDGAILQLYSARNGHAYGQILMREVLDFSILGAEILDDKLAANVDVKLFLQGYEKFTDGVHYPDSLIPMRKLDVPAHYTQGIWVEVDVAEAAVAGCSSFGVLIHTTEGDFIAQVKLSIYDVVIPEPAEAALDHEYFYDPISTDIYGEHFERGSEKWWNWMESMAKYMKELRLNVLNLTMTALMSGYSKRIDETHWSFDFTLVDEFVTKFLEWGSYRTIMLQAPLDVVTGKTVPVFDEKGDVIRIDTRSEAGEAFCEQFIIAVRDHFAEKGWLSMTMMHVLDEPHETENWLWLRALVRKHIPEMISCEPLDEYHSCLEIEGECDIYVPRIDVFDEGPEYFYRRQKAGDTLWVYTCCLPEDLWYLNRLSEQPSSYTRLIYWGCYAMNITGFLHWGFNWWHGPDHGRVATARHKGDGFVVYPDLETGGVLPSNRFFASVEGAEEYELFKIASQKYPEAAKALAKHHVRTFSDFMADADAMDYTRIRLLEMCEL